MSIGDRLRAVEDRVATAAEMAGRAASEIKLVAVSKTKSIEETQAAAEAGARALGENYVQELLRKHESLGEIAEWHFIGHLQRNKAKYLVPFCELIHGVDSARLAGEIGSRAAKVGRVQPVLIEVNVAGEDSKFGVGEDELPALAEEMLAIEGICLVGLMAMPPYSTDPEDSRPHFVRVRELRDRLIESGVPAENLRELSMGMTGDFEVAVQEGATIIRVGTAIFGPRQTT